MPLEKRGRRVLVGVGVAVVSVAATLVCNRFVAAPFILFFLAVFAGAWWGDRVGGWIVIVAAAVTTAAIVGEPLRVLFVLAVFIPSAALKVHAIARLHEAVASRETLVQVVSHDLKSPLTGVLLQEQLLARHARERGVTREDVDAHITTIERQLEKILSLIDGLLDAASIAARRLRIVPAEVDLQKVVQDVIDRFRTELEAGGYEVRVEHAGDTRGRWDPQRIEQVIDNLVSNAIKYGEGKPITLRTVGENDTVRIEVIDGGRGMAPEHLDSIFDRFQRASDGDRMHGHGLGLWIVRALVEAHGGHVSVKSEAGHGTDFAVELPRRVT